MGVLSGTFDSFFTSKGPYLPPQHRLKIVKYPPSVPFGSRGQGVGAHKDSSGWLTFLLQVGETPEETEGLQVLNPQNLETEEWIPVPLVPNSFVVNFGNAFEAATSGGVRATIHRVLVCTQILKFIFKLQDPRFLALKHYRHQSQHRIHATQYLSSWDYHWI